MKSLGIRVLLVLAIFEGIAFAFAGSADASHTKPDIMTPSKLTVGDSLNIETTLYATDGGQPIAGAIMTFYAIGSFAGVHGEMVLGQAVTDEHGVASLGYQPRSAGEHQLRIEYLTPGASVPEEVVWTHTVADSTQQLYRSTAGVQIPGLNVWLLMALVGTVWAIMVSVAFRVVVIALVGANEETVSRAS
ncbi:MAG: hypothetical protein HY475_01320 [Candidatus Terrybacteria bacterium]|nr:hypothetical protein [Candidatus Terrybacteria bacterium]